ncbi:MAG: tRNA (adenosine(37)-N6)-dimethylallyltransferase MiaA, partial [Pseudolabrys sp.]
MTMVRAVLIAGPTASGKSALALELAEQLGGVIVNADSMQVYRDLRIITARPTPEEEKRVTHRLYGFVDAAENYSVGSWCRDVKEVLNEAAAQGRLPILVGGTGLYFKALTTGLAAVPAISADIRAEVRSRMQREGAPALHADLAGLDPVTAQRVTANDRSRISRALEVVLATGRTLSDWHTEGLPAIVDPDCAVKIFITCERKELV